MWFEDSFGGGGGGGGAEGPAQVGGRVARLHDESRLRTFMRYSGRTYTWLFDRISVLN